MNIPPKPPGQPAALHPIAAGQASKAAAPASAGLHAPQAQPGTPHKAGSPSSSSSKAPGQLQSLKKALKPLALRYRGDTRDPFEAGVFREGLTAKGRGQNLLNHVIAKVPNEHDENKLKRLSAFVATSSDPAISTGFALRGSEAGYLYQIRYHGQGEDLPKYLNERHAAVAASVDECKEELKRLHQESLKLLGPLTHINQLPAELKDQAGLLQLRVKQAKDRYETKSALLAEIKLAKGYAANEAETPIKDKIDPQDILSIHLARPAPVKGEALLTPIYRAPSRSVAPRAEAKAPTSPERAGTVPPNFSPRRPS